MAQQIDMRSRREAIQRIQIGLIGLSIVLLVVAFTNIVVKTMRPDAAQVAAGMANPQLAPGAANGSAPMQPIQTEPLADLGVTPKAELPMADSASPAVGPSVPDLEPDPRLSKPMDQDPKQPQAPAAGRN